MPQPADIQGKKVVSVNAQITRRHFLAGVLAGAASLSYAFPTPAAVATQTASNAMTDITDVTVIDATGAAPLPRMTVLIKGERIAAIRSSKLEADLDGARVVDGAGRFLMPGLWDAHVHTFADRVIKKGRVHRLAHGVVAPK